MADDDNSLIGFSPAQQRLLTWARLVHLFAGIDTSVDGLLEAAEHRIDILFTARTLAQQNPTATRTPHHIVICRLTAAIDAASVLAQPDAGGVA